MQLRIVVRGRVQGVGYRYFTVRQALRYNIQGYVKNQPDGTVLVVARGDKENLDKFIEVLKEGPPLAIVEEMDIEEVEEDRNLIGFEIRY